MKDLIYMVLCSLGLVPLIYHHWPRDLEAEAKFKHAQWLTRRRRDGASDDQIKLEQVVRMELAVLRHHCSDWVMANFDQAKPEAWQDELNERLKISVGVLSISDKSHAKALVDTVRLLQKSDILFPHALDKTIPKVKSERLAVHPDHHMHMRTAFTDL